LDQVTGDVVGGCLPPPSWWKRSCAHCLRRGRASVCWWPCIEFGCGVKIAVTIGDRGTAIHLSRWTCLIKVKERVRSLVVSSYRRLVKVTSSPIPPTKAKANPLSASASKASAWNCRGHHPARACRVYLFTTSAKLRFACLRVPRVHIPQPHILVTAQLSPSNCTSTTTA
jgi:hypothetical protein